RCGMKKSRSAGGEQGGRTVGRPSINSAGAGCGRQGKCPRVRPNQRAAIAQRSAKRGHIENPESRRPGLRPATSPSMDHGYCGGGDIGDGGVGVGGLAAGAASSAFVATTWAAPTAAPAAAPARTSVRTSVTFLTTLLVAFFRAGAFFAAIFLAGALPPLLAAAFRLAEATAFRAAPLGFDPRLAVRAFFLVAPFPLFAIGTSPW